MSELTPKEKFLKDYADALIRESHEVQRVYSDMEDMIFMVCDSIEYTQPVLRQEVIDNMGTLHDRLDDIQHKYHKRLTDLTGEGD